MEEKRSFNTTYENCYCIKVAAMRSFGIHHQHSECKKYADPKTISKRAINSRHTDSAISWPHTHTHTLNLSTILSTTISRYFGQQLKKKEVVVRFSGSASSNIVRHCISQNHIAQDRSLPINKANIARLFLTHGVTQGSWYGWRWSGYIIFIDKGA